MAGATPCAPPRYVRSVALVRNPPRMSAPPTCRARSGRGGALAADAWANGDGPGTSAAMVTREFPWPRHLPDIFFRDVGRRSRVPCARFLPPAVHYPTLAL
ncbi:hypothetical protein ThrDRAFT_00875 [Frankia casuarinae]|jgi:hypothetical protein|nr:hypothetical protein CcI6DRAFT_00949 [Frankia sp. CcI6]EYT93545.1 hypothetical protein ThrDRAFT_00875 [Frankia casuarinae]KDA43692.1 hypothetical protein BMG523Draft_01352 [Frankia sp. BMG5.23]KEZ35656.1 hypothetical protein CEDDRAFT_02966 [Frankia sp. CeD]OAA25969.1 hypothetical protein AAY23_103519 [Frankia casuarinae]